MIAETMDIVMFLSLSKDFVLRGKSDKVTPVDTTDESRTAFRAFFAYVVDATVLIG